MLTNLLGNALKFTPAGEVQLQIAVEAADDERVELLLGVRDTGVGIPAKQQQRIFEEFTQVDSSTTRQFGGTGLGLAICSKLATAMGGRIWLVSEPDKGTTFFCQVPFVVGSGVDSRRAKLESDLEQLSGAPVLVIESQPASCELLCDQLARWGLQPLAAGTADEARRQLLRASQHEQRFRAVLIAREMLLPGENSTDEADLVARLLADPPPTDAVVLLWWPSKEPPQAPSEFHRLTKPICEYDLLESLLTAIGIRRAAEEESSNCGWLAGESPSLRILLAEDNQVNQIVARKLLERRGHQVTVVGDGQHALELAREQAHDLLLLDVHMPRLDGLAATRRIRAEEVEYARPRVPIIAVTACAMPEDFELCRAAGMDAVVTKPLNAGQLFEAIAQQVVRAPATANGQAEPSSDPGP